MKKVAKGMLALLLLSVVAVLVVYFFNFGFTPKPETPLTENITTDEQALQKVTDIGTDLHEVDNIIEYLERTLG